MAHCKTSHSNESFGKHTNIATVILLAHTIKLNIDIAAVVILAQSIRLKASLLNTPH
jgi:hypothetical protein